MTWSLLIVTALLFRQVMRFQEALAELGKRMALSEGKNLPPINYQNSITPPWLTNIWLTLAGLALAGLAVHGYFFGGVSALIAAATFAVAGLASGVASQILSRPTNETYYRLAFNTLVNREADYRREGDIARAEAAKHFVILMGIVASEELHERQT